MNITAEDIERGAGCMMVDNIEDVDR